MALLTVQGNFWMNEGFPTAGVSPTTLAANPGDTIKFTTGGTNTASVTVTWNNNLVVGTTGSDVLNGANDESAVFTLESDVSYPVTYSASGYASKTCTVTVAPDTDTTPDQFVFINTDGVTPSTLTASLPITVAGITDPSPISVSSGGEYSIAGGAWTSASGTVNNGQEVRLRATSNATFGGTVSRTLTIGGVSDDWVLTTQDAPTVSSAVEIDSGLTLPLSQRDMMRFFGGDDGLYPNRSDALTAYYRDGVNVPDIATNSGIATSGNINLASFVGAATTFSITDAPSNLSDVEVAYSGGGPWVLSVQWDAGDPVGNPEWAVGYSPGMWSITQYRYEVTNLTAEGTGTSTGDMSFLPADHAIYKEGSASFSVSVSSANSQVQKLYSGTVTFYAQNTYDLTETAIATAEFSLIYLSNQ